MILRKQNREGNTVLMVDAKPHSEMRGRRSYGRERDSRMRRMKVLTHNREVPASRPKEIWRTRIMKEANIVSGLGTARS